MELLNVDSLKSAKEKLYNEFTNSGNFILIEEILVKDALDRVIAENINCTYDVPEFDRSVVDGYAVKASDTQGASDSIPTFLNVVGESLMGQNCDISIESGECVYVPTGAMLPKGANACVMVEHIDALTKDKIAVYDAVAEGKNVIKKGDDLKKDEVVFKKGHKLSYADIGLLSSIGVYRVSVYKKWDITIISTGDELIDEKEEYKFGKIRDINTNLLYSLSKDVGFNIVNTHLIKDNENILEKVLCDSMKNSDVVVISGGSSKGKKDTSSSVIDRVTSSKVLTHGIAIKPGKPTITSYDKNTNTFVIGLPGHPVASAVLFKILVAELYYIITNCDKKKYSCKGIMQENMAASPGRMTIQLVNIDENYNIRPIYGRSGLIHTLSKADGFIIMETNQEGINKGDEVIFYYL